MEIEIISPCRQEGRLFSWPGLESSCLCIWQYWPGLVAASLNTVIFFQAQSFSALTHTYCMCSVHVHPLCIALCGDWEARGTVANMKSMPPAMLWVVISIVSDSGVLCFLPESMKLWLGDLLSPSKFLTVLLKKINC